MTKLQAAIASFLLIAFATPALAAEAKTETAYDRVVRTGTLRCGYIIWPPFMDKDPATGKFSGMNYDYTMAIGDSLGLKIEWTAEVQTGQQVDDLKSGKIDAICTAEGPLVPSTTKFLAYSRPFGYFPFFIYARTDDTRFDNAMGAVNAPDVKIAVIDGDVSSAIVANYFPNATRHAMVQMVSPTQMYMDVVTKKADLFIDGPISVEAFLKTNPGTLREVPMPEPLAVIPNTLSVLRGPEGDDLLGMLDQAIENIRNSGKEKMILSPYVKDIPNAIYPVAKPYITIQGK